MADTMNSLGMTRWCLGEFGGHRPGSDGSTKTDDVTRAQHTKVRIDSLLAATPRPEDICWFNNIGTTGDHRILTPPLSNDTTTRIMFKGYVDASMGRA